VNNNTYGTAEFSFWGTGFDVISLTGNNTGTIVVSIYKKSDNSMVKSLMVDTYYGYTYVDGKWVVDKTAQGELYQVPVLKVENLPYGNYKAVITVSYAPFFDHQNTDGKNQYDFYLDAIRIYDPANDGADNEIIEGAYADDGEGWPTYGELRNMILTKAEYLALGMDVTTPGALFVDGKSGKAAVADYSNYGPNNELYLAKDQSVTFALNIPENVAKVQIAMKSVKDTTNVRIYADGKISKTITVSATDLYYDFTDYHGKTVMISNVGDSVLSITNVKITYHENPEATQSANVFSLRRGRVEETLMLMNSSGTQGDLEDNNPGNGNAGNTGKPEDNGNVPETEATKPSTDTSQPEQTQPEQTEPEKTEPEQTEPEQTEPEQSQPEDTTKPADNPGQSTEDAGQTEVKDVVDNSENDDTQQDQTPVVLMAMVALFAVSVVVSIVALLLRKRRGEA
jgi:hypothetical protein